MRKLTCHNILAASRARHCGRLRSFCVDDGSKDGSWVLLQDYAAQDARILSVTQMVKYATIDQKSPNEYLFGQFKELKRKRSVNYKKCRS